MVKGMYILAESATGYGLFERVESDEIGASLEKVQESIEELERFAKMVKLTGFVPFKSAEEALSNINDVSEGAMNDTLKAFLEQNLPTVKAGKKAKYVLAVSDPKIGTAIVEGLGVPCVAADPVAAELQRGIRQHFSTFVKGLSGTDVTRSQLGLAHSYSRAKVKFNVHKVDNMIIQAIALVDQLDKDINTFTMRIREWYSWHFPELVKLVSDNYVYARTAAFIGARSSLSADSLPALEAILLDSVLAQQVLDASRSSMGFDISEIDIMNVTTFTQKVVDLADYRKSLQEYLFKKMNTVAPNLSALIGEVVGARLISHAGSLTTLAKYPASTVQILGAEKALFRALKTKGNTPKYGLIFHSSFIGRAQQKNKGRISRYLANKCSIASRIDCFSDSDSNVYGKMMHDQVDERLKFYDTGDAPRKNLDVMREAAKSVGGGDDAAPKKKKRKADKEAGDEAPKKAKKEKKAKKAKKEKKAKKAKH